MGFTLMKSCSLARAMINSSTRCIELGMYVMFIYCVCGIDIQTFRQ